MSNLPPPPPPPPPGRGPARGGPQRPSGDKRTPNPNGGDQPQRKPGGWPRWALYVLAGVVAAALLLPSLWPRDEGSQVTYTQFMQQVEDGKVESVEINNSSGAISGEYTDGTQFTTTGGGERGLSEEDETALREAGVEYEFKTPSSNWFLSIAGLLPPVL